MAKSKAEIKRYTSMLPVKLTDKERIERGEELAEAELALSRHLDDAKEQRAELNDEKKKRQAEVDRLAKVVSEGEETREIEVVVRAAGKGQVEEVRTDTNEVIKTRPLEDAEAQANLLDDEAAA